MGFWQHNNHSNESAHFQSWNLRQLQNIKEPVLYYDSGLAWNDFLCNHFSLHNSPHQSNCIQWSSKSRYLSYFVVMTELPYAICCWLIYLNTGRVHFVSIKLVDCKKKIFFDSYKSDCLEIVYHFLKQMQLNKDRIGTRQTSTRPSGLGWPSSSPTC
jgi:hypothetical protein